ncbi:dihydrodipicolinate synthase family protein [Glutamicibacter sp. JC586]|uniref:dihydrodipicolinate synthase family protein n=1 Tax=Glutamicibacter sp. JC586 TaxID=2590552 RepID=UPI0013592149|nr:dihydrodipicolinate synthase family protein [Glutamicibacter sp. JC586]
MFTGLSAFPLTPMKNDCVDEQSFSNLILRLAKAGVDSLTALGSTGSYMYLSRTERARVAHLAVEHAGGIPVLVGVGAMRTAHVLENIDDARAAGAAGILVAPVGYQKMNDEEVFELFRAVTNHSELPIVVYDNPGTTHFTFSVELYERIAALPGIASIKIPGVPSGNVAAKAHIDAIRKVIPEHVSIGVSGDAFGAAGLIAGCDAWYSVIGGTLPEPALEITRATQEQDFQQATKRSDQLNPLWELFAELGGSLRVTAAIAEQLGLVERDCLPRPLQGLESSQRVRVAQVLQELFVS